VVAKAKKDWLFEAIGIIAESGVNSLTIEALTNRLGVTKGSFYHHFKNYQEFKEAFMTFFEEEGTLQIIKLAETAPTPAGKIALVLEATLQGPPQVEVAIRAWALQDGLVQTYQERIDQQRIAYLQELFYASNRTQAQALTMARLFYAIYVGSEHIRPPITGEALRELYNEIRRLYSMPERKKTE